MERNQYGSDIDKSGIGRNRCRTRERQNSENLAALLDPFRSRIGSRQVLELETAPKAAAIEQVAEQNSVQSGIM